MDNLIELDLDFFRLGYEMDTITTNTINYVFLSLIESNFCLEKLRLNFGSWSIININALRNI